MGSLCLSTLEKSKPQWLQKFGNERNLVPGVFTAEISFRQRGQRKPYWKNIIEMNAAAKPAIGIQGDT
jgi:hypothetical protein